MNTTMQMEQQHLVTMWRDSMRNWSQIWRAWRDVCPLTAQLALESAILRRDWMHEERALMDNSHRCGRGPSAVRGTIPVRQSGPIAFEQRINNSSLPAVGEQPDSPACRRVTGPGSISQKKTKGTKDGTSLASLPSVEMGRAA